MKSIFTKKINEGLDYKMTKKTMRLGCKLNFSLPIANLAALHEKTGRPKIFGGVEMGHNLVIIKQYCIHTYLLYMNYQ